MLVLDGVVEWCTPVFVDGIYVCAVAYKEVHGVGVALFGADVEACLVSCADSSTRSGMRTGIDACVEEVETVDSHVHVHIVVERGDAFPLHNAWCRRCPVPRHSWYWR